MDGAPGASPSGSQAPSQHRSNPIHDTFWRRILTRLAVSIVNTKGLRHLFKSPGGVIFVSNYCIKAGPFTTLAEANVLQFVRDNTTIPVPTVYCAFTENGQTYIVMERIRAPMVASTWYLRSEESKAKILAQLRDMVEQLRGIQPPKDMGVANLDGGAIYDPRLPNDSFWGPFDTIDDFHRQLRQGTDGHHPEDPPDLKELISFHEHPSPPPVFTHGDLSSLNILARGDDIVGIVDWETTGWYPPYWEYTTAIHVNPQNQFWQDEIDNFLTPMPYELEMEKIRRRYFGDF